MLSLGIVTAGGVRYYLDTVASGVDDYYVTSAPGWWAGAGAERLGLSGPVAADTLITLLAGMNPASGGPLGGHGGKVAGFDLTFSAPKSVSVLAGLADPDGATRVVAAHERAVTAALTAVEEYAARGRRGAGGFRQVDVTGVTAAAFTHHTSRAGDPQLHTHVLVANRAEALDGTWGALYGNRLFAWSKTVGHIYQAALRAELTETIGAVWGPVRNGTAELVWYRPAQLAEFSKRRAEITQALADAGMSGPRAAQVAALTTRPPKPVPLDPAVQREKWRHQARAAGYAPALVDSSGPLALPGRPAPALSPDTVAAVTAIAVSPTGLTATKATFDLRDVLRTVADHATAGARPAEIAAAARHLTGGPEIVEIGAGSRLAGTRWTTTELLAVEARLLATAVEGIGAGRAVVTADTVADAVASRPSLTGEQQRMVQSLTRSGNAVDVVVGRAGTGKTYALEAAHAAWATAGIPVIGTALSARAAAELTTGTGIPAFTIAKLLADIETPGPGGGLAVNSVVAVDEAGMVGTRTLDRLARAAEQSGAKLVLIGDPRQLPELEAGGALAALAQRLPSVELVENRRQKTVWERAALDQLRHGDPAQAVTLWREHGRITLAPTAEAARSLLVDDWYRTTRNGQTAIMVALTRGDVDDLNTRARHHLITDGHLPDHGVEIAGKTYAVGDAVLTLRNDRRLGVLNGTAATITHLTADTVTVHIADRDGSPGKTVTLPETYLSSGYLTHGYATTVHKAQGATVTRAFALGSTSLYREAGYTMLSRATHGTDLYQVAPTPTRWEPVLDPIDELSRLLGRSRAQQLATTLTPTLTDTHPAPATDVTLAALHHRRTEIAEQLDTRLDTRHPYPGRAGQPSLEAAGGQSAHRWNPPPGHSPRQHNELASVPPDPAVLREWAALTAAINRREHALVVAALADPAAHLVARLGPPPGTGPDRDAWARAAGTIEAYRDRYAIHHETALGPRPHDRDIQQTRHHDLATTATRTYDQHLDRHLDQGLSL